MRNFFPLKFTTNILATRIQEQGRMVLLLEKIIEHCRMVLILEKMAANRRAAVLYHRACGNVNRLDIQLVTPHEMRDPIFKGETHHRSGLIKIRTDLPFWEQVYVLIFELGNMAQAKKLEEIHTDLISGKYLGKKNQYIKDLEYVEYHTAKIARRVAENGVKNKVWDPVVLNVHSNYDFSSFQTYFAQVPKVHKDNYGKYWQEWENYHKSVRAYSLRLFDVGLKTQVEPDLKPPEDDNLFAKR